ncbi:DUF2007 domain-containing protein [Winogradskyella sp. 3972H.M.0a.05]|uniref:putative signal transducing protein n=1 Tax=Winogradskyella sp. 3972H.M.0a.05 TaxID=2950277 RepID=UPI00339A9AB9
MSTQDFIKVYSGNFIIAQRIIIELNARGINPIVKDEDESARLAGYGMLSQGIQDVLVSQDEYDRAVEVVSSIESEMQI